MRKSFGILFILLVLDAGQIQTFAADKAVQEKPAFEKYKLIFEKNIFSRQRYSPKQWEQGRNGTEKVVLSLYVLRGVAVENQKRLAFVEDAISGQSKRLAVGDHLLNGIIAEIHANKVIFDENGTRKDILIGQEFDRVESVTEKKEQVAEKAAIETIAQPKAAEPVTEPDNSSLDEEAMLRQMMERRKQELTN